MNGFYMDESGNNGFDVNQPVLVYGGILVPNEKHQTLNREFQTISSDILSKIKSQIQGIPPNQMKEMSFFKNYEIHSKAFIDGDDMYSKVEFEERYGALESILKILNRENITIYCSIVNKELYKSENGEKKHYRMHEMAYKELLQLLNTNLKAEDKSGFLVTDNGRGEEMDLFSRSLNQQPIGARIYPDLQVKDSHDSNLIQFADIIVFIVSVFYRNYYEFPTRKKYNLEIKKLFEDFISSSINVWEYK